MLKRTIAAAVLLMVATPPAPAVVWPQANHIQNVKERTKHPSESLLVVPVPTRLPGSVGACVEYGGTRRNKKKVSVTAMLEIRRDGEVLEDETQVIDVPAADPPAAWKFSRSYFRGCSQPFGTRLREGDAVIVVLAYERMRTLRAKDQFVLSAALGLVSVSED